MYYKIITFNVGIKAYLKVITTYMAIEGPELEYISTYVF